MRTAIYVREPSTVTISATDPRDAGAQLCRYNQAVTQVAVGTHELVPGIYLVVSSSALAVTGTAVDVQIVTNDKDPWPSPKATVVALEPGATATSIQQFFVVAKVLDVDH